MRPWRCASQMALSSSRVALVWVSDLLTQCFHDSISCRWCSLVCVSTQSGHRGRKQSACTQKLVISSRGCSQHCSPERFVLSIILNIVTHSNPNRYHPLTAQTLIRPVSSSCPVVLLCSGYNIQMSKWNKTNPQPLTQQFLQNEERRKQMIIEAARRRKEKERKQQEEEESRRRDEQEALSRHKQEKKEAYVKYLRNNIYDKYEEAKRQKKEASSEIKPMAKWKKKSAEKQERDEKPEKQDAGDKQLEALDLQVNLEEGLLSGFDEQPANHHSNARKKLNEQFQKEWQEDQEDLLSSKLLDSLDLDVGTLNRDFQMKELIKQKNKAHSKQQQLEKNDEIKELRDLIGYESIVITQKTTQNSKPEKQIIINPPPQAKPNKNMTKKGEVDEVEVLNELKHKKEAKVLNWAIQEQQQAEDLFSECSSITRKKQPKALKELNEQLKNKKATGVAANNKKALETIKEVAREKIASRERKNTSNDAPKDAEKPARNLRVANNSRDKEEKPERMSSKSIEKRANTTITSNPTFPNREYPKKQSFRTASSAFGSQKALNRPSTNQSQQKAEHKPIPPKQEIMKIPNKQQATKAASTKTEPAKTIPAKPEPPKKLFGNLPPLPAVSKMDNNSIATHDMQIDVESFIKQDLINLNERERELQEELRQLHKQKREDLNQVYNKYSIRTDYKHSSELTGQPTQSQNKYYQTEADIEESLQNLENYEIRRNIESKNQKRAIQEVTEENSSQSLINPFSSSEILCNQVLKLAKNIERFDKKREVEDPNGYNYLNRVKRNNSANKMSEVSRLTKDSKKEKDKVEEVLAESQQVSEMQEHPLCRPPFIFDASQLSSNLREEKTDKIHVNLHLLKGLIDDD